MNNPTRSQLNAEKEKERTEPDIDDGEKITSPHVFRVILQEDDPGLRGRFGGANLGDVGLDGVLGDGETEFAKFATNAFGAPQPILLCHLLNQRDGFRVHFRTTAAVA